MNRFLDTTRAVAYRNIRNFTARPVVSLIPMVMPLMFFATFAGGFSRQIAAHHMLARQIAGGFQLDAEFVRLRHQRLRKRCRG